MPSDVSPAGEPPADEPAGVNWRYVGTIVLTVCTGAVTGAGLALATSGLGLTTVGGGFLWAAMLGGVALLAYLGATTSEPGQMGDAAAEPLHAMDSAHDRIDRGFHVDDAMLWLALGLLAVGLGGMASLL